MKNHVKLGHPAFIGDAFYETPPRLFDWNSYAAICWMEPQSDSEILILWVLTVAALYLTFTLYVSCIRLIFTHDLRQISGL